jgi:tRNA pseudouridine55 synthase
MTLAQAPGVLLLDKPLGLSSNAALQRVRRVFGGARAGHTGSLDPLATGMLPICLGEATKIAGDLLEGDKAYDFTLQLGERRSTGDREGEVVETLPVPPDWQARLLAVLPRFRGPQLQVPPLYSALKHQGEPLYKLARRGEDVERPARPITLTRLELLGTEGDQARLGVHCSKGTYIRTLGEDLAAAIGCCGHLAALRRTWAQPFEGHPMITLEALQEAPAPALHLLPADAALPQLAPVTVDASELARLLQGQRVRISASAAAGRVRVYGLDGRFRGVAELAADGVLHPRRLFNGLDAAAA